MDRHVNVVQVRHHQ